MKRAEDWSPTKFVQRDGRLSASLDPEAVSPASRLNVDLLAAALESALNAHATGRLVDLGCGTVPLYGVYRSLVQQVLCIDWDNSSHELRHVDLVADLNQPLVLSPSSFETAVLSDVLEHIAEPALLLREVRRILVPGGKLIGSVPFMYRLHEEPHDHYRYSRHALSRMAGQAGFSVLRLEPYGLGTDVLFDLIGKLLIGAHWRWGSRWASWSHRVAHRVRDSRLGRHLNRNQSSLPLGYIFVFEAV